jgi:flagellar hook-associated protein 1 FlgK
MANISSALNHALAGLSVSAAQSSLVARNVSNAGDENYTRKTAEIITLPGGAPMVSAFSRSTDVQLLEKLLSSNSDAAGKAVMLEALARMSALSGDPADGRSIAAAIGSLQQSLQAYEANPTNVVLGQSVTEAARDLTGKLNEASGEISRLRSEMENSTLDAVERVNNLLSQFKVVNDSVVRGLGTAGELSETLDQRDAILRQISDELSIRTTVRPNNDVLIYAEGGAVLFEGSPRAVSFQPVIPLIPGLTGGVVQIDGVAVTGNGAPMPLAGGRIAAFSTVKDRTGPQLSTHLDAIAAGLIRSFEEADTTIPAQLPNVEGLFLGVGVLPDVGNPPAGLAGQIRINPLADPQQGGSVLLLRDGGFGGMAYRRNTLSLPGYQVRITELADSLDKAQNFASTSGIGGPVSLKSLGAQSSAWVEAHRQTAQKAMDTAGAIKARASDSLARVTGVNIDHEMAILLDLEKSYQASSKVLATIDAMLSALLEAVR